MIARHCQLYQPVSFLFRPDSLISKPGPRPVSVAAVHLNFPSYFTLQTIADLAVRRPPSLELAMMPPTGSNYPPHKVSMHVKVPSVSIPSLRKPAQTSAFSTETQRRLLEADRRWRTKCILRALAAVFSLIGLSLFAAAIPQWDTDFYWGGGPNRGDWQDGFPIGVVWIQHSPLHAILEANGPPSLCLHLFTTS